MNFLKRLLRPHAAEAQQALNVESGEGWAGSERAHGTILGNEEHEEFSVKAAGREIGRAGMFGHGI